MTATTATPQVVNHGKGGINSCDSTSQIYKYGLMVLVLLICSFESVSQSPVLYMEGKVSTYLSERDMTISPDGSQLLYSVHSFKNEIRMIVQMTEKDGEWSESELTSFSGEYKDLEPMFTPDGSRLYFASDRPMFDGDEVKDFNIWYVDQVGSKWGMPVPLDTVINTQADEFYPSLTLTGKLYFTATREDSKGKEDIYYSELVDGKYQYPVSMDSAINSLKYEFNAFVDPEEKYILYSSYGRDDGNGGGDLYVSYRLNNQWQPAINLGKQINSSGLDYCPFVSADGKTMYFTSNRKAKLDVNTKKELKKSMNQPQNGFDNIYYLPFDQLGQ